MLRLVIALVGVALLGWLVVRPPGIHERHVPTSRDQVPRHHEGPLLRGSAGSPREPEISATAVGPAPASEDPAQRTWVRARAVDEHGEPIPRWHAELEVAHVDGPGRWHEGRADGEGRLERQLPAATEVSLFAYAHGFETFSHKRTVDGASSLDFGTIQLSRGATLRGRVLYDGPLEALTHGNVRGFQLHAREHPSRGRGWRRGHWTGVAADGSFELPGLHADRTYVVQPDLERGIVHEQAAEAAATDPVLPSAPVIIDLRGLAIVEIDATPDDVFAFELCPVASSRGSYVEPEFLAPRRWSWLVPPNRRFVLRTSLFERDVALLQTVTSGQAGSTTRLAAVCPHGGVRFDLTGPHASRPPSHLLVELRVKDPRSASSATTPPSWRKLAYVAPSGPRSSYELWPLPVGAQTLRVTPMRGKGGPPYLRRVVDVEVADQTYTDLTLDLAPGGAVLLRLEVAGPDTWVVGCVRIRAVGASRWASLPFPSLTTRRGIADDDELEYCLFPHDRAAESSPLPEGAYELEWRVFGHAAETQTIEIRDRELTRVRMSADD